MKRFHAHVAVNDLDASLAFYTGLFGQPPTRREADYAKWMLEDPRINFAISTGGRGTGLDHFGFQVDSPEELAAIHDLAEKASSGAVREQGETTCCYARSEKHWTLDPQGIAWEHFRTMGDARTHHEEPKRATQAAAACCLPEGPSSPRPGCCG